MILLKSSHFPDLTFAVMVMVRPAGKISLLLHRGTTSNYDFNLPMLFLSALVELTFPAPDSSRTIGRPSQYNTSNCVCSKCLQCCRERKLGKIPTDFSDFLFYRFFIGSPHLLLIHSSTLWEHLSLTLGLSMGSHSGIQFSRLCLSHKIR